MSDTQKTILITGCSSGIGLDAARGLKAQGWRVLATCRKAEDCARLEGEGLESFPLDLADEASVTAAVAETARRTGGRLDALFNNGAFACPGFTEDLPRGALWSVFEVNVFGTHDLTRQVIPLMRANGGGRIVNCSSVLGFVAAHYRGAYVASKHALEGLTDTLRLEMRGTGIHPILLEPGPITSKIRVNSIPHFERWIDWKNSHRKADYERLLHRLYESRGPDKWELPPSATTAALIRALTDRSPRARYRVTVPTHLSAVLKRVLPTWAQDWFLSRA